MTRRFGVELELACESKDGDLYLTHRFARRMTERTVRKAKFRHKIGDRGESPQTFNVKQDNGPEITTPALTMCASNVEKFSNWIKAIHDHFYLLGYGPDEIDCADQGIHIHLEKGKLTDLQKVNVIKTFYLFEPVIYRIVDPYRKNSNWCDSIRELAKLVLENLVNQEIDNHPCWPESRREQNRMVKEIEERLIIDDDHVFLGLLNMLDHCNGVDPNHRHTFEIRYSHSSIDPEYVTNWLLLNLMLYHTALRWGAKMTLCDVDKVDVDDLLVFLNEVKMPKYLNKYKRRVRSWIKKQVACRRRLSH